MRERIFNIEVVEDVPLNLPTPREVKAMNLSILKKELKRPWQAQWRKPRAQQQEDDDGGNDSFYEEKIIQQILEKNDVDG